MSAPPEDLLRRPVADQYQDVFKALGDSTRIQMMAMVAGTDELACTTLEERLPVSKSTISYHVRILRAAGLITVRKDGRYYHYQARRDVLDYFVPGFLERLAT